MSVRSENAGEGSRRKAWQEDLVELMFERDSVYSDFSYNGTEEFLFGKRDGEE